MNLQESIRRILREEKLYATPQQLIKNLPDELKKLLFKQWGAKQNPEWHPEGNTLKHILVVLKRAYHHYPDDPNMVMAALFHDLGKMDTYSINPKTNQPTAYGHEDKSTDYVEQFRNWIDSFDGTDVDEIKYLVKNHMKVKPRTWDQMKDKKKEPIKSHPAFDKLMGFTDKLDGGGVDLKESIRRILREELNSDDIKFRQEEAAELIKRYGHYSSPDLRYITRPLYAYIEYENFGRLKELGVKYRFTPISEINLNGALSRFIKERGVFNGIGGNIIRLYNDEPVTKNDISRIKRKIQNIIDEFNTKLRTNYQIDGVVGEKSSDTLRNQLNQKLTGSEFNIEPTFNNIGIKISRGFEDEYLATIPMDEIDKPQMLD